MGFNSLPMETEEQRKARLEREALAGEEAGKTFTEQTRGKLSKEQIKAAEDAAKERRAER